LRIAAKRRIRLRQSYGGEAGEGGRISSSAEAAGERADCGFNRKERKERRDKDLWCFFYAIFAFFVVNPALVASVSLRRRAFALDSQCQAPIVPKQA
jgi:hypothetical protein